MKEYKSVGLQFDMTKKAILQLKIGEKCIINGAVWRRIRATKRNEWTQMVLESAYTGVEPIDPALIPRRPF